MKRLLFFIILLIYNISLFSQTTQNPHVERNKNHGARISWIDCTSTDQTIVGIDFTNVFYWYSWVAITPNTYIEYINPTTGLSETKTILCLQTVTGQSLSFGTKYTHQQLPYYTMVLRFPNLPVGVSRINLIENCAGGFRWNGINFTAKEQANLKIEKIASSKQELLSLITNSDYIYSGIYELKKSSEDFVDYPYKMAVLQKDDRIIMIYLDDSDNCSRWRYGEVRGILKPTNSQSKLDVIWYDKRLDFEEELSAEFDGNVLKIGLEEDIYFEENILMYVKKGDDNSNKYSTPTSMWSGTGFALKDGYIMTNYHVISDASQIKIQGINGDFLTEYGVQVVGVDKSNDLALLKILGEVPTGFDAIPYGIKTSISDVGENIFVLGYPLTATMGEEIKLTNGIISARTGFDGDVTTYQLSAPVQPGNSGGPMFDEDGNVIGVICAKHVGAENVAYAVKTSQVKNLIESISDLSILNTQNTLQGKSLKDQVKEVKNYVYLIKCSK
jgi:S1-C subfamily serine protease